jgi:hypothetical protein
LVLNADYLRRLTILYRRGLARAVKAKCGWDRGADIVSEYEEVVRSPSTTIRIPSVVVLMIALAAKRVVSPVSTLFLRDEILLPVLRGQGDPHLIMSSCVPAVAVLSWQMLSQQGSAHLRKGSRSLRQSGISQTAVPVPDQLHNVGRKFPPNHLHESWPDFTGTQSWTSKVCWLDFALRGALECHVSANVSSIERSEPVFAVIPAGNI